MKRIDALFAKLPFVLQVLVEEGRAVVLNWIVVLSGLLIARGATAVALILVARAAAPPEYGKYISNFGLASFLLLLPDYGLETWLLTQAHQAPDRIGDLWRGALRLRLPLLLVWVTGVLVLQQFLPSRSFPFYIILPVTIGLAFDSLALLAFSGFRSLDQHGWVTLLQALSALVLLGLTCAIYQNGEGIVRRFAVVRAGLSVCFAVLTFVILSRLFPLFSGSLLGRRRILTVARPFMITELASAIYVKSDLVVVSLFMEPASAGIYGSTLSVLQISFLMPRALFFWAVPRLSATYVKSRELFLRRSMVQVILQFLCGSFLSGVMFLFAGQAIGTIFGPAYRESVEVLRWLSPIPVIRSLNFALAAILVSGDHQVVRTKVQVACAIFSVVANSLVVLPYGLNGVAAIYVASEALLFIGYTVTVFGWMINRQ